MQKIDYSALADPVVSEDTAAYTAKYGSVLRIGPHVGKKLVNIGVIGGLVVGFFLWVGGLVAAAATLAAFGQGLILAGAFVAIIGGILVAIQSGQAISIRLSKFASQNGFVFTLFAKDPVHNGKIFQSGHSRSASQILQKLDAEGNTAIEMGKYTYTTGYGKNSHTYDWLYMCVRLERKLPHMLLDAKANNTRAFGVDIMSNIASDIAKNQVISLEGDFDQYFTLYGPREYQVDARYIFTPDVMAVLIDDSRAFDAEIIDDKLYFYSQKKSALASTQAGILTRLKDFFAVLEKVLPQIDKQADNYSDDRIGNRAMNIVAPQGRKLKKGLSTSGIITIVVLVIWFVLTFQR